MNAPSRATLSGPERVCAVICTFNGHRRFARSIEGALAQERLPDTVLVVDNGSTSVETIAAVSALGTRSDRIATLRVAENCGPAAGFSAGMGWAVDRGFDYIWLLDDDSAPDPACLGQLLLEMQGHRDIVIWPRNLNELGGETQFRTWRGPLFSTDVVRRAGAPDKEWVWGCEDTEYFHWRLPHVHHVEARLSKVAVVRYTAENAARKRASWHYYYLSRNTIQYRLRTQGDFLPVRRRARRILVPLAKLLGQIVLQEDRKLLKLSRLALGVADGVRGRMGKTFEAAGP